MTMSRDHYRTLHTDRDRLEREVLWLVTSLTTPGVDDPLDVTEEEATALFDQLHKAVHAWTLERAKSAGISVNEVAWMITPDGGTCR